MPEFFLELFSEEIPARMQAAAADRLCNAIWPIIHALDPAALPTQNDNLKSFSGPRRVALSATVGPEKPGEIIEERGPRDTAPEMALTGFLKKHQAKRSELTVKNGYFALRRETVPEPAFSYIQKKLPQLILQNLDWPKSMRWGQGADFAWIRPLRRMVCLLDGEVIPIILGPVVADNVTQGPHFMSSKPFAVSSAEQWLNDLRKNYVIADFEERAKLIGVSLREQAANLGLTVVEDEFLLAEVSGLVDWPVVLIGKIDPIFMDLPPEVRELSMKVNQKYFALREADGRPEPYFAFVSNLEDTDGHGLPMRGFFGNSISRSRSTRYYRGWRQLPFTPKLALSEDEQTESLR